MRRVCAEQSRQIFSPRAFSRLQPKPIAWSVTGSGYRPSLKGATPTVGAGLEDRGFYGGWGWDYPYVYREGVVAVDLYDARSRQPLWHASVDQNVVGLTGEAADNKIKAAVAAIFTKYPS